MFARNFLALIVSILPFASATSGCGTPSTPVAGAFAPGKPRSLDNEDEFRKEVKALSQSAITIVSPKMGDKLLPTESIECVIHVKTLDNDYLPDFIKIDLLYDGKIFDSCVPTPEATIPPHTYSYKGKLRPPEKLGSYIIRAQCDYTFFILSTMPDTPARPEEFKISSKEVRVNVRKH